MEVTDKMQVPDVIGSNMKRGWVPNIYLAADAAVRKVIEEIDDPNRQGGFFRLTPVHDNPHSHPLMVAMIGQVLSDKAEKYIEFTKEKTLRLRAHPKHSSSWQSRNPDEGKWGGAILATNYARCILAFSGLPELGDEAAMLLAALEVRLITRQYAHDVATASNNHIFKRLVRPQY